MIVTSSQQPRNVSGKLFVVIVLLMSGFDKLTLFFLAGLAEYCKNSFINWGEEAPGEGAMRFWSGIMCATKDTLPLVGQIPSEQVPEGKNKGLYIAAGYHGKPFLRITLPQPGSSLTLINLLFNVSACIFFFYFVAHYLVDHQKDTAWPVSRSQPSM